MLTIPEKEEKLSQCPGCRERARERGGGACRGTNALLSLYNVQITKQASIRGALIRLRCDCLLSVTDDQLFGLSKQTNHT